MSEQYLRTFVALDLPKPLKIRLEQLTLKLASQIQGVRWVKPDNMHLTLCFLGETKPQKLPQLQQMLDVVAQGKRPFPLTLTQFGCFPNCQNPRILWVGIGGAISPLKHLQKHIQTKTVELGWQAEKRPYNPHLTLGRVKGQPNNLRWHGGLDEAQWNVTAVTLYQSQLTPRGAIYTPLYTAHFTT